MIHSHHFLWHNSL